MSEFVKRFFHVAVVWAFYKSFTVFTLVWSLITLVQVAPEKVADINWNLYAVSGSFIFLIFVSCWYIYEGSKIDKIERTCKK